ncbi:galactose-3-O-sulfotransferase 2-like [Saccostrea echinata]|uniref:galactose-3-O-sulfotransferase 2-like n=1 Tax=Saccostrea echinata TaxID=191078 RepID=UPI002A833615|nr:galactose-3-O-sulfotransferase 2-like [Saccostrea echinata]
MVLILIFVSYQRINYNFLIRSFREREQFKAIVFLKTHKTGGSTMVNILQRFEERHNLSIALPKKNFGELRYNYFGDVGETLSRDHIFDPHGNTAFNILCNHVIYNRTAFRKIFRRKTFYFTILREPLSNFLSAINYYGLTDGYIRKMLKENTSKPITNFFKNPRRYEPHNVYLSFTNNRQLIDLGFSPKENPRDPISIKKFIKAINNDFHFVMIMEYFDESLILIKRMLGWTFKDILYIRQNKGREILVTNITEEEKQKIYQWNRGDLMLYSHFLEKLENIIKAEGQSLQEEVSTFKDILRKVWDFCEQDDQVIPLTIRKTPWDSGFVLTYHECTFLRLNELQYLERLYNAVIK